MTLENRIYFDNAATTPVYSEVIDAMIPVLKEQYGNPSSTHAHGRIARTLIEKARKSVAKLLNVSPAEIFFTSGGTEADNMAIRCAVEHLGIKHIISTKIEHHAVKHTIEHLVSQGAVTATWLKVTEDGKIDLQEIESILAENPKSLVTLMHGNNEIGTMIDLNEVGLICTKYGAVFHSDTVQTMGYFPMNLVETTVDMVNAAAHKFNGPKGVGFIYIKAGLGIGTMIFGGSQERNMRGGTENVSGIVGLAKALEMAYAKIDEKRNQISELKSYMISKLKDQIQGVQFNGDINGQSLYTVLNVSFPPNDKAEMLLFNLDIAGISCSGGSACTSGSNVGSHVLAGIGADLNRPSIRFSFGMQNTKEEVDYTVNKLLEILGN